MLTYLKGDFMKRHELVSFKNDEHRVSDIEQLFEILKKYERKVYLTKNKDLILKYNLVYMMSLQILEDKDLLLLAIEMWNPLKEEIEKQKAGFSKYVLDKIMKNDIEDLSTRYVSQVILPFQIKMKYEEETFENISTMYKVFESNRTILKEEFDKTISLITNKEKGKSLRLS
jgi:hypothetical protein